MLKNEDDHIRKVITASNKVKEKKENDKKYNTKRKELLKIKLMTSIKQGLSVKYKEQYSLAKLKSDQNYHE